MGNYYKLKLNCARTYPGWDNPDEHGFLQIQPKFYMRKESTLFSTKEVTSYDYRLGFVYAELIDKHFEDLILGTRIGYDPKGIKEGVGSYDKSILSKYSISELEAELNKGINCFEYSKVTELEVGEFLRDIKKCPDFVRQYKNEFEFLRKKQAVRDEIIEKKSAQARKTSDEQAALNALKEFEKKRKR